MRLTPWRKHAELPQTQDPSGPSPFLRLRQEMDQLFDSFFGASRWGGTGLPEMTGGWSPDIELVEGDREFLVRVEIPGLDPKEIEVSLNGDTLLIAGEKRDEQQEKKSGYYVSERRYGSFRRSIELPPGTKPESISADYDKGVLTLRIGKVEGATPQRIPVKEGTSIPAKPSAEDTGEEFRE